MAKKLYVIGIGYRPFDEKTKEIILNSEVILASQRLYEVFQGYNEFDPLKEKVKVINNVDETINYISSKIFEPGSWIVLLASGDPMFFGIGRRAVREFGKDKVEIIPDLSSIQLAFSRIKEAWDDAFLMSLHGGPDPQKRRRLPYELKDIPALLKRHHKIAILTDRENNPSRIAEVLSQGSRSEIIIHVCERLGYPDERIISGLPSEIKDRTFRDPNVVIIQSSTQSPDPLYYTGLKEKEISHSRGLITKDEIRAIVLHKLRPFKNCIFWDIGAGSGSVSIEMAMLSEDIKVFAIERDPEKLSHLKTNRDRFGLSFEIIEGEAPTALLDLPRPDRVFIGGSGGRIKEILDVVERSMDKGIVVLNAVTIETLNEALEFFKKETYNIDVVHVQVLRLKEISKKRYFASENPVFTITAIKVG